MHFVAQGAMSVFSLTLTLHNSRTMRILLCGLLMCLLPITIFA